MFNLFNKKNKTNSKTLKFNLDYSKFESLNNDARFNLSMEDIFPFLDDDTEYTSFDAHYIYHPAWAARIVREINPKYHVDISSTLHFCSILSAFIPVKFYDFRPAELTLTNLESAKIDLTNIFLEDNTQESVSCMHTIEHIGLGRYGDPIDPYGDLKAISELKRIVKPFGSLLIAVPVGLPKIMFNAHRIYSYDMILEQMDGFELKDFSLICDNSKFITNAKPDAVKLQKYGCGCFWFVKK